METMPFSPPNILVVDDVNANLVVLTEMIRNAGYIARPVTSAKQAMSAIEALAPNLILMDISMPEVDGFEFCSMLKKSASTRDIPVIFISALNSSEDKIKGFRAGAVDYIAKPFEVEEVTLRIDTHIKMYKMQQELEAYNKKLYKIINDQIRKIYEEQKSVIRALTLLEIKRDYSKAEHLDHIGKNSKILAMSLQLSPKFKNQITNSFIDAIELAAPLHDIGTIFDSDSQTFRQDIAIEADYDIDKMHTIDGANILEEIYSFNEQNEFLKMAIDIAKYHHEHWNGSGYPMGIKGTDIPLSARIVAIADAYDDLISDTNSEQILNPERIMEIMNSGANVLFDPDIVAIFNKIRHQLKK
jgi:putative two-component system response regulator